MDNSNVFVSEKPRASGLKDHIAFYYFHNSNTENEVKSYIYYPHYLNALSIYKDAELSYKDNYSTLAKHKKGSGFAMGYTKLLHHASKAEIHAPFNKVAVVFQPLGLNHLIDENLSDLLSGQINLEFNYFKKSIQPCLEAVFSKDDIHGKVDLLDEYFLGQIKPFKEDKLVQAVNILHTTKEKLSVQELAERVHVNRKTLLRSFKKHLNCSVIEYMKLIQFRRAVEQYQKATNKSTLTDIAHSSEYYDQSEFIHHFKKLTGFKPKSFFKNLKSLGEEGTYWTFE